MSRMSSGVGPLKSEKPSGLAALARWLKGLLTRWLHNAVGTRFERQAEKTPRSDIHP